MKKKLFLIALLLFFIFIDNSFALDMPTYCEWLPWCDNSWDNWWVHEEKVFWFIWKITSEAIKYIAVFSVVALMLAWLNFVVWGWLSGEEEKVKKAKSWIMWALVWVILSISAWGLINILNNLEIVK